MKERRLELAPIHLPTSHRLPIFEVSHVSVPKRETIQIKQGLFSFFFRKTFTFSYQKDKNHVTSTKSLKYPQSNYLQESPVSTESPLSSINNITKITNITRSTIVTKNSQFAVFRRITRFIRISKFTRRSSDLKESLLLPISPK